MLTVNYRLFDIQKYIDKVNYVKCRLVEGSRGGRAVTRLASQAEDPGLMPGAGSHIIHLFIVYIHRIHHRPTDGDVKWRSRVSELYSGHVKELRWLWWNSMSLYPNSVSPFFPLYAQ